MFRTCVQACYLVRMNFSRVCVLSIDDMDVTKLCNEDCSDMGVEGDCNSSSLDDMDLGVTCCARIFTELCEQWLEENGGRILLEQMALNAKPRAKYSYNRQNATGNLNEKK